MKKIRPELARIEKLLKAVPSGADQKAEKTQVLTAELEKLRPELTAGLAELEKFMKKVAYEGGSQNAKFKARIKPASSVIDKVVNRGKSLTTMADLVAGMILVDDKETAQAITEKLSRKYRDQTVGVEEKTLKPGDVLGYHGSFHTDILLPGLDLVGELQIMTKKLNTYKSPAHDIYAKHRSAPDLRKSISPEEANTSRKLFKMGNKARLREFVEQLLEWAGNFQRGGTVANRTNNRDEKKFTKQEEIEMADNSPIFRKYLSKTGWKFQPTIHAAARAFQRRLEFEFAQWKLIHDRVAAKLDGFTRWKSGDNFLLFYSRSLEQAYITQVYPDQKTVRIITVLPKGKNLVPADTGKVLVESLGEIEVETIEMD